MKTNKLPPIHPGEILREEFLKPLGLSQNALARALNVPPRRINEIVLDKRGITADTALRLARYFGSSAEMWTGLQADYDLRLVRFQLNARAKAATRLASTGVHSLPPTFKDVPTMKPSASGR